jgi:hypothetical protein
MKKYLFGFGAMLVGAGLMFVLMHGEVSAEGENKKMHCAKYETDAYGDVTTEMYCKIEDLTCVFTSGDWGANSNRAVSCVKN